MLHNKNYRKVFITIETLGHKKVLIEETREKMNGDKSSHFTNENNTVSYVCSLCLNKKRCCDNEAINKRYFCPISPKINTTFPEKQSKRNGKLKGDIVDEPTSKIIQTDSVDSSRCGHLTPFRKPKDKPKSKTRETTDGPAAKMVQTDQLDSSEDFTTYRKRKENQMLKTKKSPDNSASKIVYKAPANSGDEQVLKHKDVVDDSVKTVQTNRSDVSQALLNEVLTVFQSNKNCAPNAPKAIKPVAVKDVSVSTDSSNHSKFSGDTHTNLVVSKTFQMSIDERQFRDSQFTIVNSHQPIAKRSESMNLRFKSSSIPLMKIDELKNMLKEKTKAKNTIEEVNRMFATVRRTETKIGEIDSKSNRPSTRMGPRVLPVVKTSMNNNKTLSNNNNNCSERKSKIRDSYGKDCQTSDYFMSSGDSCRPLNSKHANSSEDEVANYVYTKTSSHNTCKCCGKVETK